MIFFGDILRNGDINPEDVKKRLDEYNDYLRSIKAKLPPSVYAFATAPWHYDDGTFGLHDAWFESLHISELASGERAQYRAIEIQARLLGAYHDRYIELTYESVRSYSVETPPKFNSPPTYRTGHGDWFMDEIRLSERNLVLHEVEFSRGSRWIIECENIRYRSEPKASKTEP